MSRGGRTHERDARGSALSGTIVLVVVLALVAGGIAAWRYDLLDGRLDGILGASPSADPSTDPASVAPPPGLDLPAVVAPPQPVSASASGGEVDVAAVRRALGGYLADPDLGPHVLAAVAPLAGGAPAYAAAKGGKGVAIPASTTKLVTSTAALLALGPDHVFTTSVLADPGGRGRVRDVTLVGGGDPFLERAPTTPPASDGTKAPWPYPQRADLATLATATATALRDDGVRRVRLGYDDGLFDGVAVNPTWEDDYVPDGIVSPTSALWVDEGRPLSRSGRVDDPAADAAAAFAEALGAAGLRVAAGPVRGSAPQGSATVASVDSAPLAEIVERVLDVSDNEASEVLLRHVGIAVRGTGSIDAGRSGVRKLLRRAGVTFGASVFHDGSGLSRANRAEPRTLLQVLQLAASSARPELRAVVTGLPVAGFSGSLSDRMDEGPAAGLGRVRAKTGTLMGVSSLAGITTALDGTVLVFVLMVDRVDLLDRADAQTALDSAAAALGACRCGS